MKSNWYKLLSIVIVLFFIIIFSVPGGSSGVIILNYHNIVEENPSNEAEIRKEDFAAQMQYLYEHDYQALSLEEMINYYHKESFPEKSVLITFDDGYRSFYKKAFPILKDYNLNAVIFPIVSHLSEITPKILWSDPLEFSDLRDMVKNSDIIEVGSHTYDLHYYSKEDQPAVMQKPEESEKEYIERIEQDLRLSRDLLEVQIEKEVKALAWPFGIKTEKTEQIALNNNFKYMFTVEQEEFTSNHSLTQIPRFSVTQGCIEAFKELLN